MPDTTKPITASLDQHLAEVLAKIPSGQRGAMNFGVSTGGLSLGLGQRFGRTGTVGGWVSREKGGTGWGAWTAGVAGAVSW